MFLVFSWTLQAQPVSSKDHRVSVEPFGVALLAENSIQLNDKVSTFRIAAAGLQASYQFQHYPQIFFGLGKGYSPSEEATFAGAQVSGPATSDLMQWGVRWHEPIWRSWGALISYDDSLFTFEGDFVGVRGSSPVDADVQGEYKIARQTLGVSYFLHSDQWLGLGWGQYQWSIDATAKGTLGSNVRASTTATGSGEDPFFLIHGEMTIQSRWKISWEYRTYDLTATNSTKLHEIQGKLRYEF